MPGGSWTNLDGVTIFFGTSEPAGADTVSSTPSVRAQELTITLSELTASRAVQSESVMIPSGCTITRLDVTVLTAGVTAGAPLLSVGLIEQDEVTNLSDTSLVALMPKTLLTPVGTTTILVHGSTYAGVDVQVSGGAGIDQILGAYFVTAKISTSSFTAGKIRIRIYYEVLTG